VPPQALLALVGFLFGPPPLRLLGGPRCRLLA